MHKKNLRRRPGVSADPEVRKAVDAVDATKVAIGRPKLLADLRREAIAKSAAEKTGRKRKKLAPNSPKNDIIRRGKRLKGSGWSNLRRT